MITKREAAIITAYTGICLGNFSEARKYMEEILKRPVFTHELANDELVSEIKRLAKPDFIKLQIEQIQDIFTKEG